MNDRALSTTLGYVLGLSIMLLLTTGLFVAGGDFINDQRDRAIRAELQVVGQQIANDVARIDRMVQGSALPGGPTSGDINISQRVPLRVAGYPYNIEVVNQSTAASGTPHLLLSTDNPDITVRVNMTARTELLNTNLDGGTFEVRYRPPPAGPELVVTDD